MAFEEMLQLLSRVEAVEAKQDEVMSLFMRATADTLASGEHTPGDPGWKAMAARAEAFGLKIVGKTTAASAEMHMRKAAEYAATLGGEAVAEAHRRMAVRAVAVRARVEEFATFMHDVGKLTVSDPAGRPAVRRCGKPNARYFGPKWSG